ncbi:MAG: AGE family epimerase/isomerase [Bacteroidales bacterium]|nr:AGE family epimerase/isomerase [Bacteroidales bacterium]
MKQTTPAELFAAKALAGQVRKELVENILPFWMEKMCTPSGGFLGRISGDGQPDATAPVGGIMTARVLWTFASAYRVLQAEGSCRAEMLQGYMDMALRAKRLIIDRFYDKEYGGTFWSLDADLSPADTKKQIYAIAFAIYGLAELHRACGDSEALEYAVKLFHSIEDHSFDSVQDGYFEAFTRDWKPIEDMRLSDKDANESKTMNTHLHVLEAYTCLYRVWKDPLLEARLRGLILVFEKYILGTDGHLKLFFDDSWNCGYDIVSYGHDIEASWLLHEAALVLGEADVLARVEALVPKIVKAASEGFTPEGGMIYEKCGGGAHERCGDGCYDGPEGTDAEVDADRHWWVQAESVVGYFNLWEHFGQPDGLENAIMCWEFIKNNIIDKDGGEWFWSLRADGSVNREDDKAGFWKCPYHNGRMCMDIMERIAQHANNQ